MCLCKSRGKALRGLNELGENGPSHLSLQAIIKTNRPRLTLLVGPHAALWKPSQGLAQLRLGLDQATPPLVRQLPDELTSTFWSQYFARPYSLATPTQPI